MSLHHCSIDSDQKSVEFVLANMNKKAVLLKLKWQVVFIVCEKLFDICLHCFNTVGLSSGRGPSL